MSATTKEEWAAMSPESRAKLAANVQRTYDRIMEPLRTAARELGYAVTVHGSLARDIDLVAVPWRDDAVDPLELVRTVLSALSGYCVVNEYMVGPTVREEDYELLASYGRRNALPHGRLQWSIQLEGSRAYLDFSVMPRILR